MFLYHLKMSFVLERYLIFCLDFLVIQKNCSIRKIRLISKCMTSESGKQKIEIHILANISRSKDNQKMKLGQLTEYNMRNIFLEKSHTKCSGEAIPRHFYKNSKLSSISLDQHFFIPFVLLHFQVNYYQSVLKLITCFYLQ